MAVRPTKSWVCFLTRKRRSHILAPAPVGESRARSHSPNDGTEYQSSRHTTSEDRARLNQDPRPAGSAENASSPSSSMHPGMPRNGAEAGSASSGIKVERRNTAAGGHPFDEGEWEVRSAAIANERGQVVFEQTDVEVPKFWSQMATNIVVSKYFRGTRGTPDSVAA